VTDGSRPATIVRRFGPTLLATIPVVMIPALEWVPGIPDSWRPWVILCGLALGAVGIYLSLREKLHVDDLLSKLHALSDGITKAEPEALMRQVAVAIFGQGAWRLTVYRKAHSTDPQVGDHLIKVTSVASDEDQSKLSASRIMIVPETMLELSFQNNLSDARFRVVTQTGDAPEHTHGGGWIDWRDGIFGRQSHVDDTSTFRARKFAWLPAQDPVSQNVFVVMAESANASGIRIDNLDHSLTSPWLFFVVRLAELRGMRERTSTQETPPSNV
jgi:hypothetical protein